MDAVMVLEELLSKANVVKYLNEQEPKLFKEAVQYILPKSLMEPIYHCFYYFEAMDVSNRKINTKSAIQCYIRLTVYLADVCVCVYMYKLEIVFT